MAVERVGYFSLMVEDRPGVLARVANTLKEMGVNLRGLWAFGIGQGKAQIFTIPESGEMLKRVAEEAGWELKEGVCFRFSAEDQVGALCETLDQVAAEGVNLHALDAIAVNGKVAAFLWSDEGQSEPLGSALGA